MHVGQHACCLFMRGLHEHERDWDCLTPGLISAAEEFYIYNSPRCIFWSFAVISTNPSHILVLWFVPFPWLTALTDTSGRCQCSVQLDCAETARALINCKNSEVICFAWWSGLYLRFMSSGKTLVRVGADQVLPSLYFLVSTCCPTRYSLDSRKPALDGGISTVHPYSE